MVTRRAFVVGIAVLAGCRGPPRGVTRAPNETATVDDVPRTATTRETDVAADARTPTTVPVQTAGRRDATAATEGAAKTARTATVARDALDLREANVTGVAWTGEPGEEVRFDVTLYHDDDGEDGYANWWQVETLAGDSLGRRELRHAHGTREFTRPATIDVPGDVDCVVIRGHDETHGYGGQAALASLATGATRLVRQGPDPSSFSAGDCPQNGRPSGG